MALLGSASARAELDCYTPVPVADLTGKGTQSSEVPLVYHVAETGSDEDDGAGCRGTQARPLKSLMAVQAQIDAFFGKRVAQVVNQRTTITRVNDPNLHPTLNFRVKIVADGNFYDNFFKWDHPYPNVSLELRSGASGDAKFWGSGRGPASADKPMQTFFSAFWEGKSGTGNGEILIHGLAIKHYWKAMSFIGDPPDEANFQYVDDWTGALPVRNLRIHGNTFWKIGSAQNPAWKFANAAITLEQVDGAVIRNNKFTAVLNSLNPADFPNRVIPGERGPITLASDADLAEALVRESQNLHVLYFHTGRNNLVEAKFFTDISGSPIKFRDDSSRNWVKGNHFSMSGNSAVNIPYNDWFDGVNSYPPAAPTSHVERPSFSNYMQDNRFLDGYQSSPLAAVHPSAALVAFGLTFAEDYDFSYVGGALSCPPPPADFSWEKEKTRYRMVVEGKGYVCGRGATAAERVKEVTVESYADPRSR